VQLKGQVPHYITTNITKHGLLLGDYQNAFSSLSELFRFANDARNNIGLIKVYAEQPVLHYQAYFKQKYSNNPDLVNLILASSNADKIAWVNQIVDNINMQLVELVKLANDAQSTISATITTIKNLYLNIFPKTRL
jgi:hypothetical protein